ncbi:MAG: 1-deoxy-D-xylulose-5-phosphate reductoisomerase, partial [Candidatus Omnitrophota bacterium]|nr:1-deoxy-D-xylulose-5-phosphate reductoisomerase [Candidatus Omnitrophota bacterium]
GFYDSKKRKISNGVKKKKICILGSTGSIGRNALKVISDLSGKFEVCGLCARSNAALLAEQANRFMPGAIAIGDEARAGELRKKVKRGIKIFAGNAGVEELAAQKEADLVLAAISGSASIRPVYSAVSCGKDIALASKEALVSAGHLIIREAKRRSSAILPVDSEHSAIFQCLAGNGASKVKRLYITASGGPLREISKRSFKGIPAKIVLKHPKWKMGRKVSVDSATMMNKGLEVIEAKWLFGIEIDRIKVLIHPEAIVHSMVEFVDGSVLAQLGVTNMRLPIQYALSFPERYESSLKPLDFISVKRLSFHKPDMNKFPSLRLAYEAAREGGSAVCVLTAANEMAVGAFLRGKIRFTDIPIIIEKLLSRHKRIESPSLNEIEEIEKWVKEQIFPLPSPQRGEGWGEG